MKNILPTILVAVLCPFIMPTFSCTKIVTRTVMDTVRHAWQPVPFYNDYGQAALSAFNVGDSTLAVGGSFGLVYLQVKTLNFIQGYYLPFSSITMPVSSAPYLDGAACSYAVGNTLVVMGNSPHSQYNYLFYTPTFTPGAYPRFQQVNPFPSQSYPVWDYPLIRDRYALTPVETIDTSNSQMRFDLVTWDSTKLLGTIPWGDTPHVRHVIVNAAANTVGFSNSVYACEAFYDKFFVFYADQFFRIDTAGKVKAFGYSPAPVAETYGYNGMFTYGNSLFIHCGTNFFVSTDEGETWSLFNSFPNNYVAAFCYRNVGKDLYATFPDLDMQIWKVVISGNSFAFSELNNDGLESNLVTSITKCGPYVFATTLGGIFYRDTALFNQLKTPIR